MQELTDRGSYVRATMADGVCVLEATASWCPQCKAIAPFVDRMTKKYPDARFYRYDVDTAPDIAQELGANQMPTFNVFRDGDLMDGVTGAKAAALEKAIREAYGDGKVVEEMDADGDGEGEGGGEGDGKGEEGRGRGEE